MEEYSNLNRWSAWDTTRIKGNNWWDGLVVSVKDDTYRQKRRILACIKTHGSYVYMYVCTCTQHKILKDIAVKTNFKMLQKASHGVTACSVHACMGRKGQDYLVHTYFYSNNVVRHYL